MDLANLAFECGDHGELATTLQRCCPGRADTARRDRRAGGYLGPHCRFTPDGVCPSSGTGAGELAGLLRHHRLVTFGCFNNTAKLNAGVFEVWARVLAAVPDSRLLLKWRTFQDARLCQSVREAFAQRGIASERIELRPFFGARSVLPEPLSSSSRGAQRRGDP